MTPMKHPRETHGGCRGGKRHPLYHTWLCMVRRCTKRSEPAFENYGGRGITICDRWRKSFAAFCADVGEKPSPDHTLDRIDNNGNYEPGNVRWATRVVQNRNSRRNIPVTFRGETRLLIEWSALTGINYQTLHSRIIKGWDVERAMTAPVRRTGRA